MSENEIVGTSIQWCRRRGCKRTPKCIDLMKIRTKSLNI